MTGRMSQDKGKRAERDLANWLKVSGYPDAARAVKTGDRFAHDGGDLVIDHWSEPGGLFRLVIEVKHHAGGLTELQVAQFGAKLIEQVNVSHGNMGVLVERRDRQPDPARWWVHIHALDFSNLVLGRAPTRFPMRSWVPVRCSAGFLLEMLQDAGLAQRPTGVVSSATSPPDGAAQLAGMAVADGVSPC